VKPGDLGSAASLVASCTSAVPPGMSFAPVGTSEAETGDGGPISFQPLLKSHSQHKPTSRDFQVAWKTAWDEIPRQPRLLL